MGIRAQISQLTTTGFRQIPHRLGSSLVIVVGIAGVVAVLIPILAMYLGFRSTVHSDGRPDRAMVLSRYTSTEYDSSLSREAAAIIANAPGVRHDSHSEPLVSAEIVLAAPVARKRDHSDVNVTFRGVGSKYFLVRPELRLIAGRMYRAGTQELLVGAAARSQFEGLDLGSTVRLQDGDWKVVGVFAGGNGARESEVIADAQTVMSAYKLDAFNSMSVALDTPSSLLDLRKSLEHDSRLSVTTWSEPDYLTIASSSVNQLLRLVTYAVGSIMALGALLAALNSMYSTVAARASEIATLRAIGFAPAAVVVAVLAEATLLALLGAAIGVAVSYLAFDGITVSTLGGTLFDSQLVYALRITPALVATSIGSACALGILGALPPAIRAARGSIAANLYEL